MEQKHTDLPGIPISPFGPEEPCGPWRNSYSCHICPILVSCQTDEKVLNQYIQEVPLGQDFLSHPANQQQSL